MRGQGRKESLSDSRDLDGSYDQLTDSVEDEFELSTVCHRPEGLEQLQEQTKFTRKELQVLYRGFKNECPSGIVNEENFKQIYSQFFPQGDSSTYATFLFNAFDTNHDGSVSFEDFVAGLSVILRGTVDDRLNWAFNLYDLNKDGCITKEEMLDIMKSIYDMMGKYTYPALREEAPREHVENFFQKMDRNKDGVVTIEEFIESCQKVQLTAPCPLHYPDLDSEELNRLAPKKAGEPGGGDRSEPVCSASAVRINRKRAVEAAAEESSGLRGEAAEELRSTGGQQRLRTRTGPLAVFFQGTRGHSLALRLGFWRPSLKLRLRLTKGSRRCRRPFHPGIRVLAAREGEGQRGRGRSRRGAHLELKPSPGLRACGPTDGGRGGPAEVAAAGGRRMVQKESQATLEERESELSSNPAASAGASLEPPAAPAPGEENPAGAGGAAVAGAAGGARRFLCGVVEGFYGRPWVMEQRKELFRRNGKLNTYLYAPKDDYKHRMFWREMYSVEEAEQLMTLISAAREYEIEFIYAISPGLDITFSNPKEVSTLKRKLDQVSQFGCRSFALLFDDIDHNMCAADKEVFSSFAHAQVSITNEIYQYLGEPETFLFCPTVSKIIKRAPVIWDNIHANDYDQKRLFLGPYKGRSTELIPRLKGVLTNPNCEFEANYVAIHTLATWYKSNMNGVRKDVVM
ncbi:hypothetical protein H8959_011566, partial [Pygathrix nigripes]